MLIRSQDKEILLNFNSMHFLNIEKQIGGYVIYTNSLYPLGNYSTKEKAIKVLDMIQDAYEKYEYEKVFKTGLRLFDTFQMPEDEEVM